VVLIDIMAVQMGLVKHENEEEEMVNEFMAEF
jgi:hypothetical protein